LSKPTFYRKLRKHPFAIDEIAKISETLFIKEAYLFQIQEDLKLAKSDVEKGSVVDHETVMADIKKEIYGQNGFCAYSKRREYINLLQ